MTPNDFPADSLAALAPDTTSEPLLGPDDPPPFGLVHPHGRAPVLLVADHAGRAIPRSLGRLGLDAAALDRHIAYDIGIVALTRRMAERLDAPALMFHYSRLVIDANRSLDDPTSICAISDGTVIEGNRDIGPDEAERRASELFRPYHAAIEAMIERRLGEGITPAVVSLHSFTPSMHGLARPWHIGVLWAEDGRIAEPFMTALARDPRLCIGDNQPYSGRDRHGFTIETHALSRGLANVLIEVRQDLIETEEAATAWADRLVEALAPILADPALTRAPQGGALRPEPG